MMTFDFSSFLPLLFMTILETFFSSSLPHFKSISHCNLTCIRVIKGQSSGSNRQSMNITLEVHSMITFIIISSNMLFFNFYSSFTFFLFFLLFIFIFITLYSMLLSNWPMLSHNNLDPQQIIIIIIIIAFNLEFSLPVIIEFSSSFFSLFFSIFALSIK